MRNLNPAELKSLVESAQPVLLDVRTPEEWEIAHLPGSQLIPMQEIEARRGELNPAALIVVLCHHGVRSERVARYLERNGFADVCHLAGGLDAWAVEIDPGMARY